MNYITKKDDQHAQDMAIRWESCSREAKKFAAHYVGAFGDNILPHVVAEAFDRDPDAMIIAALGHKVNLEETKAWLKL